MRRSHTPRRQLGQSLISCLHPQVPTNYCNSPRASHARCGRPRTLTDVVNVRELQVRAPYARCSRPKDLLSSFAEQHWTLVDPLMQTGPRPSSILQNLQKLIPRHGLALHFSNLYDWPRRAQREATLQLLTAFTVNFHRRPLLPPTSHVLAAKPIASNKHRTWLDS